MLGICSDCISKEPAELALELVRQGYSPPESPDELKNFAIERIVNLEKRALTFREIHPLSLQTSAVRWCRQGSYCDPNCRTDCTTVKRIAPGRTSSMRLWKKKTIGCSSIRSRALPCG